MSEEMKAVFEALLPPGAIWRPKPDGDFDRLLGGMGDNAQEIYEYIEALAHLRDPRRTTILSDLEKEYGVLTIATLTELERREQLAGIKYAIPDTASWELVQDKLRAAGFDGIIVTPNDPAVDPDLITGELLVNGPVYIQQNPLYLAQANGDNMFAGNGLAVAGYFINIGRTEFEYEIPDLWRYWRYVFFVGGAASGWPGSPAIATYNVDYRKEQLLKRLILKYKPLRSWAVLVVNYVMFWTAQTAAASYSSPFYSAAYGAGLYLLGGSGGVIQTSPDSIVWSQQIEDVGLINGAAFGADLFVIATSDSKILTSPDAVEDNWTLRSPGGSPSGFNDATFGNDLFVVVGNNGQIRTSPNGINWTVRTAAGGYSGNFWSVTYGGGLFLAVGSGGEIQTSPDGITWTAQTPAGSYTDDFRGAIWGNDLFVIVGDSAEIQTSPDGITWTARTPDASYSGDFYAAVFGNDRFVIIGSSGEIQSSPDGETWQHEDPDDSYTGIFRAGVYRNGIFVIAGDSAEIQTG